MKIPRDRSLHTLRVIVGTLLLVSPLAYSSPPMNPVDVGIAPPEHRRMLPVAIPQENRNIILRALAPTPRTAVAVADKPRPDYTRPVSREDDVIVVLNAGTGIEAVNDFLSSNNLIMIQRFGALSRATGNAYFTVHADSAADAERLVAKLKQDPRVEAVSLDYIKWPTGCPGANPNDTEFTEQWALCNEGQTGGTADADIDATEAWQDYTGSGAPGAPIMAVLDTGVDYQHPDLQNNMWVNAIEASGTPGVDDDANGYVDDIFGADTAADDSGNNDGDPMDIFGHGTHVAGIIGAEGDNAQGVAGVNWQAKIMAVKGFPPSGGMSTTDELEAIDYILAMKQRGENVVAVNASYGCFDCYSDPERLAIQALGNEGIAFVAAAGNDANDNDIVPHYPSNYDLPNLIAVAATDHNDQLASFSDWGLTSVDLAAPGVDILNTYYSNSYRPGEGNDLWFDDMESGSAFWTADPPWQITTEQARSPSHGWSDSPGGDYANNTLSDLWTGFIDLSGQAGPLSLGFWTIADLEYGWDFLDIYFYDGATWQYQGSLTGTSQGSWVLIDVPIDPSIYGASFAVGLVLHSDSSITRDGVYLDDIGVGTPVQNHVYAFLSGTSMAAPHVTGAAGFLAGLADEPVTDRVARILGTVDLLPGLPVSTEGRLNLYNAASSIVPTDRLLTVTTAGSGTVTSNPPGINCGGDCSEAYPVNTPVALTAAAASGWVFTGWSGACTGTGTCNLVMNADKSVTANFILQPPQPVLTVTKSGTGTGLVTSSPAGINCGSDCTQAYPFNTPVTLSATPAAGSTFGGWGGHCNANGQVTMDGNKTCTAAFTAGGDLQQASSPSSPITAPADSDVVVPVDYDVSDGDNTLVGLGLRVHFDSSKVSFVGYDFTFSGDLFAQDPAPVADSSDFDGDPATDMYVSTAWTSFAGQWPNTPLPQRLLDLRFHLAAGLQDGDTTSIKFSASSTSAGYTFQGMPARIEVGAGPSCSLDVDGNGHVDALTDGVMTVRYEFGFPPVIPGIVGPGCIRCTAAEVEAYLQQCEADDSLNVDGNPDPAHALTDGILTVRYEIGFTGATLINGAVGPGCTRCSAAQIEAYLGSLQP